MRCLLDTGVLLRMFDASDPHRPEILDSLKLMLRLKYQPAIAIQNAVEFWNVMTRPVSARGGYGLSVATTSRPSRTAVRAFGGDAGGLRRMETACRRSRCRWQSRSRRTTRGANARFANFDDADIEYERFPALSRHHRLNPERLPATGRRALTTSFSIGPSSDVPSVAPYSSFSLPPSVDCSL